MTADDLNALIGDMASKRLTRRQILARGSAIGLSAPALASALASCDSGDSEGSGTLSVRNQGDVVSADPLNLQGTTDEPAALLVYEGLVQYLPDSSRIVNVLADTFREMPSGREYRFTLKRGIRFHKGYGELTAEDVKFSFERVAGLTKPRVQGNNSQFWASLAEVRVISKYEGRLILKYPDASFVPATLATGTGSVYSRRAVEELGDRKFATSPVGTGPYELAEWSPRTRFAFRRFADYGKANPVLREKPAEWDRIVMLPIVDDNAAATAVRAGDIVFGYVSNTAVPALKRGFGVVHEIEPSASSVLMHVKDRYLSDINLRYAIRHAIDVPAIITAAYDGLWSRANSLIPPSYLGHWPDAPQYDQALAKAKSYMQKTGLSGVELKMAIYNGPQERAMAQVVQANLAEVGIKVNIVTEDPGTFNDVARGGGGPDRQLTSVWNGGGVDPSYLTSFFTCRQIELYNWTGWCSPEYSRLQIDAKKTSDREKRQALYVRMQQLMDESAAFVWMGYPTLYYAHDRSIRPSFRKGNRHLLWNFKSV